MSCSERSVKCLRVFSAILITLIWLIGAAIFGVSLWLLLDFWIKQFVEASEELKQYRIYMYIFIAVGGSIIFFGIVGMFGVVKPNKFALGFFLVYIVLIFLALGVGCTLAYIYRVEIENTIEKSNLLPNIVKENYGTDSKITNAMDTMQIELKCCGGESFLDYKESTWMRSYIDNPNEKENKAPLSCCSNYYQRVNPLTKDNYCLMYQDMMNTLTSPPNKLIYKQGCRKAIVQFLKDNIGIVAAVGISILSILLFIIISVSLIIYCLRQDPIPQTDDVVYEMARCQEKSPYPTRGTGPYANLYNN